MGFFRHSRSGEGIERIRSPEKERKDLEKQLEKNKEPKKNGNGDKDKK